MVYCHKMATDEVVISESIPVARFVFPTIQDNPNGWGPCEVPVQFKDTPYQPFSKDDRLGKVIEKYNHCTCRNYYISS